MNDVKEENKRMIFEVAKTADAGVKLKQEYEDIQTQLKEKLFEMEQHQRTMAEDQEKYNEAKSALDAANIETAELKAAIATLQTKFDENSQTLLVLREQMHDQEKAFNESRQTLSLEIAQIREKLAVANAEVELKAQEVESQRQIITDLEEELQLSRRATQTQDDEVVKLRSDLAFSRTELDQALRESELHRGVAQNLQLALNEAKNELEAKMIELGEVKSALSATEAALFAEKERAEVMSSQHAVALEAAVKAADDRADSAVRKSEEIQISMQEVIDGLKHEVETLNATVGECKEKLVDISEEKKSLRNQLDALQISFTERKNEMETQLDAKTAENTRLISELNDARCQNVSLEDKVAQLTEQFEEQGVVIAEKTVELDSIQHNLITQIEVLKEEKRNLAEANESAERLLADMQGRLQTAVTSCQALDHLKSTNEKLNTELSDARHQLEAAQTDISRLEQSVQEKQAEIENITHDLEARLVAAAQNAADQVKELESKVASASQTLDALESSRQEAEANALQLRSECLQKDDIISNLKEKAAEVLGKYKKLQEHANNTQEQVNDKDLELRSLKQTYDDLVLTSHQSLEAVQASRREVSSLEEQLASLKEELTKRQDEMDLMESTASQQVEALKSKLSDTSDELERTKQELVEIQSKHAASMASALAASESEWSDRLLQATTSENELTAKLDARGVELQAALEQLRDARSNHESAQRSLIQLQELHQHTISTRDQDVEAMKQELAEALQQISTLQEQNEALKGNAETVSHLHSELDALRSQLEVEIEGANAARTALETYKKRAATALKKATSESKSSLRRVEEETSQLQQDLDAANARASDLESELKAAQKQYEEMVASTEAHIRLARDRLDEEKTATLAEWKERLAVITAERDSLLLSLESKKELDERLLALEGDNERLRLDLNTLQDELKCNAEAARKTIQQHESEIDTLKKQLEEAQRTATTQANGVIRSRDVRSKGSSLNGHGEEPVENERGHLAAAVADIVSLSLPTPASTPPSSSDVHTFVSPTAQPHRNDEALKLKKQLTTLEDQVHQFQKRYEDTLALLEESNRQKKRIQELHSRTTDGLNIEYLKNIVIKYIETQNQSDKDRLIPVIATVLHFSPQEMKKINDAQQRAQEESAGILGGVFSLFGGSTATPPPKPLAIPVVTDPSQPPTGMITSNGLQVDEDDNVTPLNPFASLRY
ncbi:hypothetical protein PINS_up005699 [Pythium insidiosum]|nr:hypothetical protein PINS_up005699 [Pythium insidiosum]